MNLIELMELAQDYLESGKEGVLSFLVKNYGVNPVIAKRLLNVSMTMAI